MPVRVLLGKSINSNLGHGSGKFGLYISRNGDDVTSCTKDQLVFNTDDVGNNSGAVDLGQFQVLPVSGTSASVNTSVGAGATATVNFIDVDSDTAANTESTLFSMNLPATALTTDSFPIGNPIELITNPLVANEGDIINVTAGTAAKIHVHLSVLEIS